MGCKNKTIPPIFILSLIVFINIIAFSMVFPLLPTYAKLYNASDLTVGLLAASFALAQLLFSPVWGMLSDKFGRKPIMGIGLLGMAGSFLFFGLAGNLFALFLSRFVQGMFSGAAIPAARAYAADISTKEDRVRVMGKIGAALALGVILGPVIGGLLAEIHVSFPFFGGAAVALLSFFLILKALPESSHTEKTKKAFQKEEFISLFRVRDGIKSPLMPLFFLSFLWSFVFSNNQVAVPLLAMEKFSAGAVAIGTIFTIKGVVSAIIQFFFISKITSRWGERPVIVWGMLILVFGFFLMPFLPKEMGFLYFAAFIASIGTALARPVITALLSQETKEGQGVTMGTANAFESLGRLIGPLLGGLLFSFGMAMPFLVSAIIVGFALYVIVVYTNFLKRGV